MLDGAFTVNTWEMTLTGQDFPETVHTQCFSANGLDVLGVPPILGRVFHEVDGPAGERAQRVVVLTYRFWQRKFGGRPEAVGQTLHLNREPYTEQAPRCAGCTKKRATAERSPLTGSGESVG